MNPTRGKLALGFDRPSDRRGFLPLLVAAIGSGLIKGGINAITANQTKQRNKGFIDANYRLSKERLDTSQKLVRENTAESLNARGLSPIAGAMASGASGGTASTLAGQVQGDTEHQLGLEQQDLENQHTQALAENKAQYTGALVNSAVGAADTAMSVYGAGKDLQAARAMAPASASSPIRSAMLSGGPVDAHMGVDPIDPFGHPDSAWNPANRSTLNGNGLSNSSFNTGNV